ncbi:hypothetical protein [uncultured Mucilaginibacter sp.]|uniref:hypothetical protein n=1 Tax=uncultured Mucilaginibacter sp. TaxID=797541 RepID=UPI0025E7DE63|nr:hypothetical protein [uncultured Mucilaginibacter sp.]
MYHIYHNSLDEGHSYESFSEHFLQICQEHKNEKRAMAFAFILYDLENPQLSKVLNDRDYWMALNEISGKHLTVFSIHSKVKRRVRARTSYQNDNLIQISTAIPSFENPSISTNTFINRYFGDTISVSYPALLFFQVNNEQITDALIISLRATLIEESFLELKKYISAACDALEAIDDDYKENYKEIFDQLELSVKKIKQIGNIKRVLGQGKSILSILKLIKVI